MRVDHLLKLSPTLNGMFTIGGKKRGSRRNFRLAGYHLNNILPAQRRSFHHVAHPQRLLPAGYMRYLDLTGNSRLSSQGNNITDDTVCMAAVIYVRCLKRIGRQKGRYFVLQPSKVQMENLK